MNQEDCRYQGERKLVIPVRFAVFLLANLLLVSIGCHDDQTPDMPVSQPPVIQSEESTPDSEQSGDSTTTVAKLQLTQLLTDRELEDGWVSLFDGVTLFGWTPSNEAGWQVGDGAIVGDGSQPGTLSSTIRLFDFVLEFEYRVGADAEGHLIFGDSPTPEDPPVNGLELDLLNPLASVAVSGSTSGSADVAQPVVGQWCSITVSHKESQFIVATAGHTAVAKAPVSPSVPLGRAFVSFQLRKGSIAFRNIKIKPLGLEPLFNGRDLDGWNAYPEMKSRFTVTDEGYLNVQDGRGQLETAESYGDFVLQLECISHAVGLNSGIFFRCIPGELMNGYESQIQNVFEDGDRAKPEDCGTGGIFRRQNARYVVADDLRWFFKTIVADGAHIAVWVNGLQVTDWTDTRSPDLNPRKGLRKEPGTIMIQGHDPTTNLSFRNLRIGELP